MASHMRQRVNKYFNNDSWKNKVQILQPEQFKDSSNSEIEVFKVENLSGSEESQYEYGSMLEENIESHLESNPSCLNIHKIINKKPFQSSNGSIIDRNPSTYKRNNNSEENTKTNKYSEPIQFNKGNFWVIFLNEGFLF